MPGGKSDYLENKLRDHALGGPDFTRPATVYVRLYTVAPSDTGGGTEVSTADWTNYAPEAVANNDTNWPNAVTDTPKSNGTEIDFGTATIVSSPTVVAFGVWDASSGGNLLIWATLTTNRTIINGDPVKFPVGSLAWTET